MSFTLYNNTLSQCKKYFNLFHNITNNTVIICNPNGIHLKCSNNRFQINSILDEISFKNYTCVDEHVIAISIKQINNIFKKYKDNNPIRILYNGQPNLLIIINNHTHVLPCQKIDNKEYIKKLNILDDLDYHIEFEIESKYIYSLFKNIYNDLDNKSKKTITFNSDVTKQCVYINNTIITKNDSIDIYYFVTEINQTYMFAYINQIIKNTIKQKINKLLFGLYKNKSMKITSYINDYNYVEYFIPPCNY